MSETLKATLSEKRILVDSIQRPFVERILEIFRSAGFVSLETDDTSDQDITVLRISGSEENVAAVEGVVDSLTLVAENVTFGESNHQHILGQTSLTTIERQPHNFGPESTLGQVLAAIETSLKLKQSE
ncbi:hypothetical protein KBC79_04280 [Candidatus Woesebacteria bacterium]|nr:hypothetical protein [Candidatus Woesebacteria bacterium]